MFYNVSIQGTLSKIIIFLLLQVPMSGNKGLNYIKLDFFQNKITFYGFRIKT